MKGKLILIRHGESEANRDRYAAGWLDSKLTPNGLNQAKKAGEKFLKDQIKFNLVFTSRLKRAMETAEIILITSKQERIPIISTKELNERFQGDWEGISVAELEKRYSGTDMLKLVSRDLDFRPPSSGNRESENFHDVKKRVSKFYEDNIKKYLIKGKTILLVSHSCTLRALMVYLKMISEKEAKEIKLKNAEPYEYKIE